MLDTEEVRRLERLAQDIRLHTLETLNQLGFGHYGGSLSIVEVLAALYGKLLDISPANHASRQRDHFILSKGHAGPALYSTLYLKGFFDHDFLWSLNTDGTRLPSHPDRNLTPGVDMTTGSLGQGMSVAAGLAYAKTIDAAPSYTYSLVGDGELNEGQCWEAAQFAAHQQLSQFVLFVDNNRMQLDGSTDDICQSFDLAEKFRAFGWQATRVDGHDIAAIVTAVQDFKASDSPKPKCLVLDTIKGHGLAAIEQLANNHHLRLSSQLASQLDSQTRALRAEVEA